MSAQVFRIFLSSTFGDFQVEREALRARVWPKLEDFCRARGAAFQVVDLRWGVSEADGMSHDTLRICLDEIAHCQKLSPKPNFLMFLGDRYGWRPLPTKIPVDEFDKLTRLLSTQPEDRALLQQWYRCDDNAVPSHFRLLPRDGAYQAYAAWGPIEARLSALLRGAAETLGVTPERRERYFLSATHLEIVHGALKAANTDEHVFGFFRDIDDLATLNPIAYPLTRFSDFISDELDTEATRLRNEMRLEIDNAIPDSHQFSYRCQWLGSPQTPITTEHLNTLCQDVEHCLLELISSELALVPQDQIEQERLRHLAFADDRIQHFLGREVELAQVHSWLNDVFSSKRVVSSPGQEDAKSDDTDAVDLTPAARPPLIVHGHGGVGKSAFMARALVDVDTRYPNAVVIRRFVGATPRSSDLYNFLSDLLREIARRYDQSETLPEGEIRVLSDELIHRLDWATSEKPLILMVDALDQFDSSSEARHHQWLPMELPKYVALIFSVLDGPMLDTAQQHFPVASEIALPNFSLAEGGQLLDALLLEGEDIAPERQRRLTQTQRETVLSAFANDGRPLYLKLAVPFVRRWASWTQPEALPKSLEALVESMLRHLQAVHGQFIADRALDYLTAARYGVSDNEMRDLLWRDADAHAEFEQRKNPDQPPVESLPPVIWSRLYFELAPYLTSQSVDGALLHRFFHRVIGEEIARVCLADDKALVHRRIADYFAEQPLYLGIGIDRSPNLRKCMEEPWHRIKAGELGRAESLLTDFDFCMAKSEGNRFNGLLADYRLLIGHLRAAGENLSANLNIWEEFIRTKAHILRRGDAEWPSHKILLQLAIEHADDSPLTLAAEIFLDDGKCHWEWLRNLKRPEKYVPDPCLMVFEGHKDNVVGAVELKGGRFMSWSWDRTLRLWDAQTGLQLALLEGHSERIVGAMELPDGNLITWSWDHTLRIWDTSIPTHLAVLKGHSGFVRGAQVLTDGRILSWSDDTTLRIWNSLTGLQLNILVGHVDRVIGAKELTDGRLLSWSADNTLRIWDILTGVELYVLEGHVDRVIGANNLSDGRIISWSADSTLRIWDISTGIKFNILQGHNDRVIGIKELTGGRLLSWSADKSMRVWDMFTGMQLAELAEHNSEVKGALELDASRILSWYSDKTLRIWNVLSARQNAVLVGHKGSVNGAVIMDDSHVLSWSNDKTLRLWNSNTGEELAEFIGHSNWVMGVLKLSDNVVMSWSRDASLRLWHLPPKPNLRNKEISYNKRGIPKRWELSGGRWLIQYDASPDSLFLWNDNVGSESVKLVGHNKCVDDVRELSSDGLLTWSANGELLLWDVGNEVNYINLIGHEDGLFGALELPDDHIISWSADRTLRYWNRKSGKLTNSLIGHEDGVYGALKLCDGLLVSWSGDGTIRFWDLQEGRELSVLTGHEGGVYGVLELADDHLLSWSEDGTIRLWDRRSRTVEILLKSVSGYIKGVNALANGLFVFWLDSILTTRQDYSLRILEGMTGNVVAILSGHTGAVKNALQLTDGRILSIGSNEVMIWDLNYQIAGTLSKYNNKIIYKSTNDLLLMAQHINVNSSLKISVWPLCDRILWAEDNAMTCRKVYWHGNNNDVGVVFAASKERLTTWSQGELLNIAITSA